MNAKKLNDTQNSLDERGKAISWVGVCDLVYPFKFEDDKQKKEVVGKFKMGVFLPKHQKGTHMSRFIESLNLNQSQVFNGPMYFAGGPLEREVKFEPKPHLN